MRLYPESFIAGNKRRHQSQKSTAIDGLSLLSLRADEQISASAPPLVSFAEKATKYTWSGTEPMAQALTVVRQAERDDAANDAGTSRATDFLRAVLIQIAVVAVVSGALAVFLWIR